MSYQSRHVYTREERIILQASFARQSHPDINEKERLAKLLNCNIIQISNWFQNHRVNSIRFLLTKNFDLFFSVELRNKRNLQHQTLPQRRIRLLLIKHRWFITNQTAHLI
jgi:hypothetical protein